MIIETSKIPTFDISHLHKYITHESRRDFEKPMEHYRLLAYLSTLFNNGLIVELGTRHGASAIALSHNPTNMVITYDIVRWTTEVQKENVDFKIEDILTTDAAMMHLLKAKLIFIDIDPHNSHGERHLYQFLKRNNYKGLLVMDDIKNYEELRVFWESIDVKKYDLTDVGHFSGSGLVDFSGKVIVK